MKQPDYHKQSAEEIANLILESEDVKAELIRYINQIDEYIKSNEKEKSVLLDLLSKINDAS